MGRLFEEKYYQAIRPYMPEEARRALDNQVPIIRSQVSEQIEEFSNTLAAELTREIDTFKEAQVKELEALTLKLEQVIKTVTSKEGTEAIQKQTAELRGEVEGFRNRTKGFGERLRKVALTAANSAGLPIPGNLR